MHILVASVIDQRAFGVACDGSSMVLNNGVLSVYTYKGQMYIISIFIAYQE